MPRLRGYRFGHVGELRVTGGVAGFRRRGRSAHRGGQIKHLLRLDIARSPSLYKTLAAVAEDILLTHWPSLLLGLGTVLIIVIVRRISGRLPASLIGILMAGTIVAVVGVESMGVAVIGEVSRSLPGVTAMSTSWLFDEEVFTALVTGSLAVAALGVVEAISIARELARQGGQRIDVNQELVGQGVANIAAGAFSGDGAGPRTMTPHGKNLILASADSVAIDTVAARLMGFDPMSIPYLRMCHERGLGAAQFDEIEILGEDIAEVNFGFHTKKSLVIWGDQLLRTGRLRFLEQIALHSPLVVWAPMASNIYHDWLWYPTVGKSIIRKFAKTEWGKLFEKYKRGG